MSEVKVNDNKENKKTTNYPIRGILIGFIIGSLFDIFLSNIIIDGQKIGSGATILFPMFGMLLGVLIQIIVNLRNKFFTEKVIEKPPYKIKETTIAMLKDNFIAIMSVSVHKTGNFSFKRFFDSVTSLLNVYVNTGVLESSEKIDCAKYLVEEYNKGLEKQLNEKEINEITNAIVESSFIDFDLLKRVTY